MICGMGANLQLKRQVSRLQLSIVCVKHFKSLQQKVDTTIPTFGKYFDTTLNTLSDMNLFW